MPMLPPEIRQLFLACITIEGLEARSSVTAVLRGCFESLFENYEATKFKDLVKTLRYRTKDHTGCSKSKEAGISKMHTEVLNINPDYLLIKIKRLKGAEHMDEGTFRTTLDHAKRKAANDRAENVEEEIQHPMVQHSVTSTTSDFERAVSQAAAQGVPISFNYVKNESGSGAHYHSGSDVQYFAHAEGAAGMDKNVSKKIDELVMGQAEIVRRQDMLIDGQKGIKQAIHSKIKKPPANQGRPHPQELSDFNTPMARHTTSWSSPQVTSKDDLCRDYFQVRLLHESSIATAESKRKQILHDVDKEVKDHSGNFEKQFPPVKMCSLSASVGKLRSMLTLATEEAMATVTSGELSHVVLVSERANPNDGYNDRITDTDSYVFVEELGIECVEFENQECYYDVETLKNVIFRLGLERTVLQAVTFHLSQNGKSACVGMAVMSKAAIDSSSSLHALALAAGSLVSSGIELFSIRFTSSSNETDKAYDIPLSRDPLQVLSGLPNGVLVTFERYRFQGDLQGYLQESCSPQLQFDKCTFNDGASGMCSLMEDENAAPLNIEFRGDCKDNFPSFHNMTFALERKVFKKLHLVFEPGTGVCVIVQNDDRMDKFFANVAKFTFTWEANKFVFTKKSSEQEGGSVVMMDGAFRFDDQASVKPSLDLINSIFGNVEIVANAIKWKPTPVPCMVSSSECKMENPSTAVANAGNIFPVEPKKHPDNVSESMTTIDGTDQKKMTGEPQGALKLESTGKPKDRGAKRLSRPDEMNTGSLMAEFAEGKAAGRKTPKDNTSNTSKEESRGSEAGPQKLRRSSRLKGLALKIDKIVR